MMVLAGGHGQGRLTDRGAKPRTCIRFGKVLAEMPSLTELNIYIPYGGFE